MSDPNKDVRDDHEALALHDSVDDDDVRDMVRSALRAPPQARPNVLGGVQRKLRKRSQGKFYADGWSTSGSPKTTYFVTSLVMLVIVIALYFALAPTGWGTPW